jgi:hypothetical protein
MKRPAYEITIRKDGQVTVEVKGSHGAKCLQLADAIKEILGAENERRLTAEYYASDGHVRIDATVSDSFG